MLVINLLIVMASIHITGNCILLEVYESVPEGLKSTMTITTDDCETSKPSCADPFSRGIDSHQDPPEPATPPGVREDTTVTTAEGSPTMEIVSEPLKNHHIYPMSDIENGKDGTVATKSIRSLAGHLDYSSHQPLKVENNYPLLQGVPIDDLPPRFQKLLILDDPPPPSNSKPKPKPKRNSTVGCECFPQSITVRNAGSVQFYPGHIPIPPLYFLFVAVPFLMCLVGMVVGFAKGTTVKGGFWAAFGLVTMCVAAILWSGISAYRNHRKRSPLFARDSDGNRKSWPGDWKAGTYLVGRTALVHYDGVKAWLFPVDEIVRVEHTRPQTRNAGYHTVLVFRSSIPNTFDETNKETVRYELDHLEEPRKGCDIQRWFDRCTEPIERRIP